MRHLVFILPILSACGHTAPGQIRIDSQPTPNACLHTWAVARDAWKEQFPLGLECSNLDADVPIELTAPSDMPRPDAAGCTVGSTMYLRSTLTDTQAVSVATHEWIHVMRLCAYGQGDAGHTDARLWAATDPEGVQGDTVEAFAVRNAPRGRCLEGM